MKNKTPIILLFVTVLSILFGFIKESIIVSSMGISRETDLFVFSTNLPILIFSSIGTVISTTFMPIFTDIRINYSIEESNSFSSSFMKYIIVICLAIVAISELFPKLIVKVMAPGLINVEQSEFVIRVIMPSIIILAVLYVFIGILNSYNRVIITSAVQIPMHVTIIISVLFVYKAFGIKGAIITLLLGSIIQVLLFYIPVNRLGWKYCKKTKMTNKFTKQALVMIAPMAIGVMAMQINSVISSNIASRLEEGSMTIINLANKLNTASYSAIGYLVVILIFPILSEYAAKKDINGINNSLEKGIKISFLIILPIMVLMIMLGEDIIKLFFESNNFNGDNIEKTTNVLIAYSCGLVFWGIKDILNRAYYSLKETKISMVNGIITVIVNIILSLLLIQKFNIVGLAMANTGASMISVVLLIRNLKLINIKLNSRSILKFASKLCISATIMIISVVFANKLGLGNIDDKTKLLIRLITIGGIGMAVYSSICFIMVKDELKFKSNGVK